VEYSADWLTEEQVIAETGIGMFTLDRWRREGLVPWERRFLALKIGTRTVYPPIAVPMVRRVQELRRAGVTGFDRLRDALWAEGYPVDIVRWHDKRLLRLEKLSEASAKGNIKTAVVDASSKGRLRRNPLQPIFNRMRRPEARRVFLEWGVAIGVGLTAPASIYTPGSPAAKAFSKAVGTGELPEPSLEIENMSFARLREINTRANVSGRELARLDYNRLAGLVKRAASLPWRRIREVLGVTHQGGPATPIAPFERLIGLWQNLDFRACLIPFLMFVRSRPCYRYELDERFASLEIELQALSERVTEPGVSL
jgi:hypothetical protein